MLGPLAAQGLVDGLSAITLGASVAIVARHGRQSALGPRIGFALSGLCLFFAIRAGLDATGSHALELFSLMVVCVLPLAALMLAEGVLRRHAPWPLKGLVTAGGAVMIIALLAADGGKPASSWGLGGFIVATVGSVTALLFTRDLTSLSRQENAGINALVAAGGLLIALSITDFLPAMPVGLSGVGAAMVAFVLNAGPSSGREARMVLTDLVVMTLIAAGCGIVFAGPFGMGSAAGQERLAAIILSLLLASAAVLSARRLPGGQSARDLAHALANADLSSLDRYLSALEDQPLLAGLRLAQGSQLAEYDASGLGAAMAARPVWTLAGLADPANPMSLRAHDELGDLMARNETTHALLISRTPLRIALLTLPEAGASDTEVSLALFAKLAAIAAKEQS